MGSGRDPGEVREGSEKCFKRLRSRLMSESGPRIKQVCEPLEECTDFWPELTNYHQFLTILQTSDFRAQGQWF